LKFTSVIALHYRALHIRERGQTRGCGGFMSAIEIRKIDGGFRRSYFF